MTAKPEIVFQTQWFEIRAVDPGQEVSGTTEPYYCLVRPNGVIAFALDRQGAVVLVEQYRPPLGRVTLEMPAGSIEPGESHEEAIAREMLEETGLVCESWFRIAACRVALHREDVTDYFYVGIGAHPAAGYQRKERGTVRFLPRCDFLELVKSRRFEQTAALGGLYLTEKILGFDLLTADLATIPAKLAASLAQGAKADNGSDRARPDQQ